MFLLSNENIIEFRCIRKADDKTGLIAVDLDGNPAIWQQSIVEMLACAWLLSWTRNAN